MGLLLFILLQNKLMKTTVIFLMLFVCAATTSMAQFTDDVVLNLQGEDQKFLNWGYYLGINKYDFQFEYEDDTVNDGENILVDTSLGFNIGLIGELRLNEFLDLRFEPGLLYTRRTLNFPGVFPNPTDAIREVNSTYIRFPLLLKASAKRFGNWKPYITGGLYTALNLGSNEDSQDDNSSGVFRMKENVYGYELGFGIDFYLEYFKFSPSIRGVFALTDELVPDNDPNSPHTGNLNAMRTRGFFINFTFE